MASTLTEYLNSQEALVREAAEVLPHEFSRCTYSLGPLRSLTFFNYHRSEIIQTILYIGKPYIYVRPAQNLVEFVQPVQLLATPIMNKSSCEWRTTIL